jgi:hypothetical protein
MRSPKARTHFQSRATPQEKWSETNPTLKAQFKSVFRGKTT